MIQYLALMREFDVWKIRNKVDKVLDGGGREGERGTNDLTSCVHYALQCFPAVFSTATAPHSDAAGQDAFNGAPVECVQDGYGSFLLQ